MNRFQRETDRLRADALVRLARMPAGSFGAEAAELQLRICDLRDSLTPIQQRLLQLVTWIQVRIDRIHRATSRRT